MKRTTVTLTDDLAALAEREASRRGTSVSEVVRSSLASTLRSEGGREIPWAGICDVPDLAPAASLEEALGETWADDLARGHR